MVEGGEGLEGSDVPCVRRVCGLTDMTSFDVIVRSESLRRVEGGREEDVPSA